MKKILLLLAAACMLAQHASAELILKGDKPVRMGRHALSTAAPLASSGENEIVFGYCQDYYTCLGTGTAGVLLKAAIGVSKAKSTELTGAKITKIRIGYGECSNRNVTVFISKTLAGTPLYTQTALMNTLGGWNEVVLDTPYEIDGTSFYIGYQVVTRAASDAPLGVDGIPTSERLANSLYAGSGWGAYGSSYGAVCIKAVIAGDNFPEYEIAVNDYDIPGLVQVNSPFNASLYFINNGTATINDAEVSCSIDGAAVTPAAVQLTPASVAPGEVGRVLLEGLVCNVEGFDIPVTMAVVKVNGESDANVSDNVVETTISSTGETYPRNVVVEEWTGNWCGFCPRGIVGMDYMTEHYGDDGFIGIAVHSSQRTGDGSEPMECRSYIPLLNKYCDGFPGCIINRTYSFDPNTDDLEYYYKLFTKTPSFACVNVSANYYDDQTEQIYVDSDVKFAISAENAPYKLAFVIIEDGVGPYAQSNYFSGGSYGPMGGWESKGGRVSMVYEHVARDIFEVFGIDNSVPAQITGGTVYPYSTTLSTANVTNIDNCHIIALLINSSTGEIENAAKTSISHQAGVGDAVADSAVNVFAENGRLLINGNYNVCYVYGVDGTACATACGESSITLPSGLYVVRVVCTDNSVVTQKVFVK